MIRQLEKIGKITPKSSNEITFSKISLGFEKLDRDVFDPEKAYDKVAKIGVKLARIQSGWEKNMNISRHSFLCRLIFYLFFFGVFFKFSQNLLTKSVFCSIIVFVKIFDK